MTTSEMMKITTATPIHIPELHSVTNSGLPTKRKKMHLLKCSIQYCTQAKKGHKREIEVKEMLDSKGEWKEIKK